MRGWVNFWSLHAVASNLCVAQHQFMEHRISVAINLR